MDQSCGVVMSLAIIYNVIACGYKCIVCDCVSDNYSAILLGQMLLYAMYVFKL